MKFIAKFINSNNIYERAVINWMADQVRIKNDLLALPSFCDVEFCGGYTAYRTCSVHPVDKPLPVDANQTSPSFVSSDDEVLQFIEDYGIGESVRGVLSGVEVVNSFKIKSKEYSSLGRLWSTLTLDSFSNNAFAFFTSIAGKTRLLAIYKYLFFKTRSGRVYIQALVYEIPTRPIDPFGVSPYAFAVDLSQRKMNTSLTLVSFHRLEMDGVFFVPLSNEEVYSSPNVHILRTYKIFKSIDYPTK